MRIYDPRIGKFLSVDPITRKYPELTPYQFASNRPIQAIDIDGLEAYFNNSGEFVKWGVDKSKTAPIIVVTGSKEIKTTLTVESFQNRVYWLRGEGASGGRVATYYAHTIKNAKAFGYHGEGFTEEKLYKVLLKDNKYESDNFLAGLPNESKTKNYQSYKNVFAKKGDFKKWDADMKANGSAILKAEIGETEDPTRGATNWGGGNGNYKWAVKQYGEDNVETLKENGGVHNFYNMNTKELKPKPPAPENPPPVTDEIQGAQKN
ncbi:MAG: hypothetical protein IPH89_02510 [Bacteroidetes bacterium]|nr:hypothetical protein [Bacteroidota bacterium]